MRRAFIIAVALVLASSGFLLWQHHRHDVARHRHDENARHIVTLYVPIRPSDPTDPTDVTERRYVQAGTLALLCKNSYDGTYAVTPASGHPLLGYVTATDAQYIVGHGLGDVECPSPGDSSS